MKIALFCHLAPDSEAKRMQYRADHLRFIEANRDSIVFGGPLLDASGHPETMLLVVEAVDELAARAFLRDEPYTAHGIFAEIRAQVWLQVLPEAEPGALARQIELAQA